MHFRPRFACYASLALLLAGPAFAFTGGPESRGEVQLPGRSAVRMDHADIQRSLDDGAAWRGFRARYGEWNAQWNELTKTPHRAIGRGIVLNGYANDAASVDRAVRAFIGANTNLFGAATLRTVRVDRTGDVWYASYRQTLDGMDVLFSDWEFRVHASGKLMMFGADGHQPVTMPSRGGALAAAAAREAARVGVAFDATRDHIDGGSEQFVLPYPTNAGLEYRVVTEAHVVTVDPPADWLTYVDVKTGQVLFRINRVRDAITGTVTGMIHPLLPTDPLTSAPFPNLTVSAGGVSQPTTTSGTYSLNVTGTVTVIAGLSGPFANVMRSDAANATFSQSATNPAVVNIGWGNPVPSHDAERDAFYSVNVAHAYIKSLDPTFTGLDYSMPVAVNINATCNAFWNGTGVNFYAAGGGCVNTATVPSVVYHEYGHGVNDRIYIASGAPGGMINGSLHEGMADVNAAFLQDDPIVGKGFSGLGTFVRNTDNTNRWPDDNAGEVHTNGLIIGGAFWDLRQAVGLPVAQLLAVRARHGTPDDANDGVAFAEMFTEVLVADDNDGNLANGTPHSPAIISAFNAHGIGTNYYLSINPDPVADQPSGALFPVTATIAYGGPAISSLDTSSPTVHFRLNPKPGVVWSTTPMLPTGLGGQYRGRIPAPDGAVVEYYITASDVSGGSKTSPPGAPDQTAFRFLVGTPTPGITWNMETDPGWAVGGVLDDAVTGIWVRVDPVGTFTGSDPLFPIAVQPADDHTPAPGTQCWVTGNVDSATSTAIGFEDVDGGQTTLTTATFNPLTGGVTHPVVEYYRWYTNAAGSAPGLDVWETDISNDGGGTWTPVENTMTSNAAWQRILFRIEDYVAPTNNMRMRFIASDFGDGSVVEAAVDDFRVLAFPPGSLAVDPMDADALAFAPPAPNPFRGRVSLRFTLPAAAPASLVLYDVSGRAVRHLAGGTLEAGSHAFEWDGRDDARVALPSGLYFADLTTSQQHLVRRVIQVR